MSKSSGRDSAPLYPAFCHVASPTFHKWVKLTAQDVYGLRQESGYDGQHILFHLNHPIQYVYLCGPVVAITFPGVAGRFVFITLDDGSGMTIEVKVERILPDKKAISSDLPPQQPSRPNGGNNDDDEDADHHKKHVWELSHPLLDKLADVPTVSPTTVKDVTVVSRCEDRTCYEQHLKLDDIIVDVGTVLKVKGTVSEFRKMRQVELKRLQIVQDSEEEVRIWEEYSSFCRCVLSKPWRLSDEQLTALDEKDREAARKRERKAQRKLDREAKRAREEALAEERRQGEAKELDGNALDRLGWKPSSASAADALLQLLHSNR